MTGVLYQPFPIAGNARGQIWRHAPATRRPRHFHAEPELNLVTAGTARFGVGDKILPVAAGDLLWWTPGQDHELLDASPDFDLFVIGLAPAFSSRVLGREVETPQRGHLLTHLRPDQLRTLLPHCLGPAIPVDTCAGEQRIGDLWRLAHGFREQAATSHSLTRRSVQWVLERPEVRRGEMARKIRTSPAEISRHFHQDMGLPLSAYRTRVRLLRFIALADSGAHTLLSAALEAGFGSYSQCHRMFQQILGCSPRAYFATAIRQTTEGAFAPHTRNTQNAK